MNNSYIPYIFILKGRSGGGGFFLPPTGQRRRHTKRPADRRLKRNRADFYRAPPGMVDGKQFSPNRALQKEYIRSIKIVYYFLYNKSGSKT